MPGNTTGKAEQLMTRESGHGRGGKKKKGSCWAENEQEMDRDGRRSDQAVSPFASTTLALGYPSTNTIDAGWVRMWLVWGEWQLTERTGSNPGFLCIDACRHELIFPNQDLGFLVAKLIICVVASFI